MALSPGIPTSFVPKQPVQTQKRKMSAADNIFLMISIGIFALAVIASGAIFAYQRYLTYVENAKSAQLATEEQSVNPDDVSAFVRLQSRFSNANTLLTNHIVLSQFFDELEKVTLQSVSFGNLTVTVTSDNAANIEMQGTAKSFNSLAAQSNAFAADPLIKRAIISGITINPNGTVGFTVSADLDPKLVLLPQTGFTDSIQSGLPLVPATGSSTSPGSVSTTTP